MKTKELDPRFAVEHWPGASKVFDETLMPPVSLYHTAEDSDDPLVRFASWLNKLPGLWSPHRCRLTRWAYSKRVVWTPVIFEGYMWLMLNALYFRKPIFVGISGLCFLVIEVNAFEEDDTVKLQIAAHIGPREHVEKNFRETCRQQGPWSWGPALDTPAGWLCQVAERLDDNDVRYLEVEVFWEKSLQCRNLQSGIPPGTAKRKGKVWYTKPLCFPQRMLLQYGSRVTWVSAEDMYRSNWTDETRCSLKEVTLDISLGRISIRRELRSEGATGQGPERVVVAWFASIWVCLKMGYTKISWLIIISILPIQTAFSFAAG